MFANSYQAFGEWNFCAEDLTRRVMGETRPGSHSAVYVLVSGMDSGIVQAHEEAHCSLNSATTIGKYLSALSVAARRIQSAQPQLRQAVRSIAALCWYTHEGYATAMQELHAREIVTDDELSKLSERLPDSYRLARDQYLKIFDVADIRYIVGLFTHVANIKRENCEEIVCRVLSIAAMSVPIAAALDEASYLPSHRLLKLIERNAPDNRLKHLSQCWTSELLIWCLIKWSEALERTRTEGTSRVMDSCLNELAHELCRLGGLEFEPPDAFNLGVICEKLGLSGTREHDGRETPLRTRAVLDSVSIAISRNPTIIPSLITLESAASLISRIVDSIGVTPDIICEVMSTQNHGDVALIEVHLYCDKAGQLEYLNRQFPASSGDEKQIIVQSLEMVANLPDNAAFLMIRIGIKVAGQILKLRPDELPGSLQHRSFVWLIADIFFDETSGVGVTYDQALFERTGRLVFPHLQGLNGTELYSSLHEVPPKVALPSYPTTPSIIEQSFLTIEESFDTKLGLLFLKSYTGGKEYALPVVFPRSASAAIAQVGGIPVSSSTYVDTCICHTLVTGMYAALLASKFGGYSYE